MDIEKNYSIDLLRIFAALGVIIIHVQGTVPEVIYLDKNAGMLCVPFFFAVSLSLFISNLNINTSFKEVVNKSWKRIIIPYLVWTAIYVTLLIGKSLITHGPSKIVLWQAFFYGGSAMHLYFLSMLLALQVIVLGIVYLVQPKYNRRVTGLLLLVGVFMYLFIGNVFNVFGIVSIEHITCYVIFAFWAASRMKNTYINIIWLCVGFFLLIIAFLSNWYEEQFVILNYVKALPLGGISLMLICMGLPFNKMPKWLLILSSLTYGIYLCHVVFLEAFEFAFEKIKPTGFVIDIPSKLVIVIMIFICSAVFVLLSRKIPIARQLLLGEKK